MNFFINKNATLPVLKMELILDGRHDFRNFHELVQNSNIYFSMTNIEDGFKRLCRVPARCAMKSQSCNEEEEYYLAYQFTARDTSKSGIYRAQFELEFLDGSGTLIVPIKEELNVHILDNRIKI